jgi:PHP family Zn ribbon phosphoesterase
MCGSPNVTRGVFDRIVEIQDRDLPGHPAHRPPYRYQVPLQFLPKVGPTTLNKLINRFGTEMHVLHHAQPDELESIVSPEIAANILAARNGTLQLLPGGGGRYGRAVSSADETQMRLF